MLRVLDDPAWVSYERYLRLKRRAITTVRDYAYSYRNLSDAVGKPAVDATRLEIESWLESRLEKVSDRRVAQDQRNLKIFYRWAVAEEIIARNPMTRIPTITVKEKAPTVIDPADLKALDLACRGSKFNDIRDRCLFAVLNLVGTPRMGELITMTVSSVDMRNDLIAITGKTGTRQIPLTERAAVLMDKYLRVRGKHHAAAVDALWVGKKGAMTRRGVEMLINRRATQAGIEVHLHAHLFRHTSATRAADAEMADSDLEFLYGWQPGSPMKHHYTRATRAKRAQDAARRLG